MCRRRSTFPPPPFVFCFHDTPRLISPIHCPKMTKLWLLTLRTELIDGHCFVSLFSEVCCTRSCEPDEETSNPPPTHTHTHTELLSSLFLSLPLKKNNNGCYCE